LTFFAAVLKFSSNEMGFIVFKNGFKSFLLLSFFASFFGAFSLLYEDFQISVFKRRLSSSASYIHLVAGFLL